jgi:outer membrane translocation and assembly module TamA
VKKWAWLMLVVGCATIPPTRYGVRSLELEGVEAFDGDAIRVCLATQARNRTQLNLDLDESTACGEPPFEGDVSRLNLWTWPWSEWPYFDRVTVEQDVERIERWYAARGYHGARVVEVRTSPESAMNEDLLPDVPRETDDETPEDGVAEDGVAEDGVPESDSTAEAESAPCERLDDDEGCAVDVRFVIEEGEATFVRSLDILGIDAVPEAMARQMREQLKLNVGDRWDEERYNKTKEGIEGIMFEAGHARATVEGRVRIDRPAREAHIVLEITPGPVCTYGEILVDGPDDLPMDVIIGASNLEPGMRYDRSQIQEAQRRVYGLGGFSGVVAEPVLPDEGNVIPVRIRVTPARHHRYSIGAGILSGVETRGRFGEVNSVDQWDVHLSVRYENRNMLGGLRRLILRETPRVIFGDRFPTVDQPRVGNLISAEFRQPGFLEPNLTLTIDAQHDFGRDPYDTFFRHRLDVGAGLERFFLKRKVFAALGLPRFSLYRVPDGELRDDGSAPPSSYQITYLQQILRVDLRDDNVRPTRGVFLQLDLQESGYFLPSTFNYVRIVPDVRGYVPFGKRLTLAGRFVLGAMFITEASEGLDEESTQLGPRDQRFYGGGSTDVRGYLPGRLGDGRSGGNRKWLASLELRLRVTESFGVVAFGDAGDVSADEWRFNVPQFSFGVGLRYFTIVGAIRLDVGWAPQDLQFFGGDDPRSIGENEGVQDTFFGFPGAIHVALGESF